MNDHCKSIAIAIALLMIAVCGTVAVGEAQAVPEVRSSSGLSEFTIYKNTDHTFFASGPSSVIDSNDKLHVIYSLMDNSTSTTISRLMYADNTAGFWSTPIAINTSSSFFPYYGSIAVDSSGNSHVVYYSMSTNYPNYYSLYYATNTGGSWVNAPIATESINMGAPSIVVDSSNTIHIAYSTGMDIVYGTYSDGSFINSTIASENNTNSMVQSYFSGMSMAIDTSKHIWITYVNQTYVNSLNYSPNGVIHILSNEEGDWKDSIIGPSHEVVTDSLTIDHNGKVHIAYGAYNETSNLTTIGYATNSGGSWTDAKVAETPGYYSIAYGEQIVVDSNNSPVISYSNVIIDFSKEPFLFAHVDVATFSSGTWNPVTFEFPTAIFAQLQIRSDNRLNLVYVQYIILNSTVPLTDSSLVFVNIQYESAANPSVFGLDSNSLLLAGIVGALVAFVIISGALLMGGKKGPEEKLQEESLEAPRQPDGSISDDDKQTQLER